MVQTDFMRDGSCAVISTKIAKEQLMEKGKLFDSGADSDFVAIIFIKVIQTYSRPSSLLDGTRT